MQLMKRFCSGYVHTAEVEPARYAHTIEIKNPEPFKYPHATSIKLANGLTLLYYNNDNIPQVTISLSLRALYYYDPEEKLGLGNFVAAMLTEGTKNYTAEQFADIIESRGMSFSAHPGGIVVNALKEDLPFALEMIREVLTNASFDVDAMKKYAHKLMQKLEIFGTNRDNLQGN